MIKMMLKYWLLYSGPSQKEEQILFYSQILIKTNQRGLESVSPPLEVCRKEERVVTPTCSLVAQCSLNHRKEVGKTVKGSQCRPPQQVTAH